MILVFLQWLNAPKRDGNHNIDWLHRYFVQIINKERHQHIKAKKKKKSKEIANVSKAKAYLK